VAEAWLRQGLAQAALGHYEMAVAAIRESIELKPELPKGRFRIWGLFGDDQQAARRYVETLVKKAEDNPKDANLAFLAGVHLYFDEQPQQGARYINRAIEAGLGERPFVRAFLPVQERADDKPRKAEF
jgi:tetratricopeptide (TPR) repeat protein